MKQLLTTCQAGEIVNTRRFINTPSEFAKRNLFYVQETGYTKSLKSHVSKRSHLASYLFIIVLSGRGSFQYNNLSYELSPYDCILVDCMDYYAHQSDTAYPWELLWVHFNGPSAREYYRYFTDNMENIFHPVSPDKFICLVNRIMEITETKAPSWEIVASMLITDLLTGCITAGQTDSSEYKEPAAIKLDAVRDYLDHNYSDKLLLDDLALHFFISKYHLSREFKKCYGTTILDYLTIKRINHAKAQLRFTDQSIANIAEESGYPDASYFNKVFHRYEAMTATEYRKKWRG